MGQAPATGTLRNSPSAFARHVLGVDLHPAQDEWVDCRAPVKVACCGRRFGKSFSTAADHLWFGGTKKRTEQFVIAPTHDQSIIIFRYVVEMLRDSTICELLQKTIFSPYPELMLRNGSVIRARSAGDDARNLRGHGADRITLDEAAFIPETVYATISPLLATSDYGELALISTPFGKNTFYDFYARGMTDDASIQSFHFPSSANPHLSPEYLEQQRRDMTAAAYAQEYGAEFREDQNTVFPWSVIQAAIDQQPPILDPNHRYVIGYDPAKYQDRSGVVVLDITSEPWRVAEVADISGRDYLAQVAAITDLHQRYGRADVLLDATSHDQMLEQLQRDKVRAEGFRFTNESKGELISGLAIALEQGRVRIPNDPNLIRELTYYRYELTRAGNVKLGAPEKAGHHDDLVTALALACQHAKQSQDLPFAWMRNDPTFRATVLRDRPSDAMKLASVIAARAEESA